jgi:hypothetical protein
MKNIIFIHIGKCAGSTVEYIFEKNNIKIKEKIHVEKPIYDNKYKYVILLRNPIKRFISAFNWRRKLVLDDKSQEFRFENEKTLLEKYKNVNNLSQHISEFSSENGYIHHINENIDFYLTDFLNECEKENIIAVMTTETLNKDLKHFFNIDLDETHLKKNKKNENLSNLEYSNLKQYLKKDYACIDKLYELGLIDNDKYSILSS